MVAAALAAAMMAAPFALVDGCISYLDLCEPENWFAGTLDIARLEACCPDPGHGYCALDAGRDAYCCPAPPDAATGEPDAAAGEEDASADGPIGECEGACAAGPPSGWDAPALVWIGEAGPGAEAPPCPASAALLGYEGYADLDAPSACGGCQCGPPSGTCHVPASMTANAGPCGAPGGVVQTPFDPPSGWDGACTSHGAVVGGALCSGVPCVQSLTIAPLVVEESGCAPSSVVTTGNIGPPPAVFHTHARVCRGFASGSCAHSGDVCSPPVPPGFLRCVFHDGDVVCPPPAQGPYQERHLVYAGVDDGRSCSPCVCGPPEGSACIGAISVFSDPACVDSLVSSYLIDAEGPACVDLVSGAALGSKSATPPSYVPGACAPSGATPMGEAKPIGPTTLCCAPSL